MRDVTRMRTTLNIDDDVLRAVKELAKLTSSTAGRVISDLARQSLEVRRAPRPVRNGVPLLSGRSDSAIVTPDALRHLERED
jgi:hypothetical protein